MVLLGVMLPPPPTYIVNYGMLCLLLNCYCCIDFWRELQLPDIKEESLLELGSPWINLTGLPLPLKGSKNITLVLSRLILGAVLKTLHK